MYIHLGPIRGWIALDGRMKCNDGKGAEDGKLRSDLQGPMVRITCLSWFGEPAMTGCILGVESCFRVRNPSSACRKSGKSATARPRYHMFVVSVT